jgi:RNase P protein component
MKRIVFGLVLLTSWAAPALVYAQDDYNSKVQDNRERMEEQKREQENPLLGIYNEKQKENAAVERQYQRTLRATDRKAAPTSNDPWASMRGDASKPGR